MIANIASYRNLSILISVFTFDHQNLQQNSGQVFQGQVFQYLVTISLQNIKWITNSNQTFFPTVR
jgi:hypothetical protein